jgi:hypothetical protein
MSGIQPATLALAGYHFSHFRQVINVLENGGPKSLTGFTLKMDIREQPDSAALIQIDSVTPHASGSVITVVSAAGGVIEVYISKTQMLTLPLPVSPNAETPMIFVYDIKLVKTASPNDEYPYIAGTLTVNHEVTQ